MRRTKPRPPGLVVLAVGAAVALAQGQPTDRPVIRGLTGEVDGVTIAVPAAETIRTLAETPRSADVSLQRMAEWAMNYLVRTPRPGLGYEPVFQCHLLRCPPVPEGQDPVVA
jgi:hypothetical protein